VSEFRGKGLAKNSVSVEVGVNHLTNNFGAGDSDNESVFVGVVFSLFLGHQSFSGVVVGFSFSSSSESGLESLEISVVLV